MRRNSLEEMDENLKERTEKGSGTSVFVNSLKFLFCFQEIIDGNQ